MYAASHFVHLYGFSPVWVRRCVSICCRIRNLRPQKSQSKCGTSCASYRWFMYWLLVINPCAQGTQLYEWLLATPGVTPGKGCCPNRDCVKFFPTEWKTSWLVLLSRLDLLCLSRWNGSWMGLLVKLNAVRTWLGVSTISLFTPIFCLRDHNASESR